MVLFSGKGRKYIVATLASFKRIVCGHLTSVGSQPHKGLIALGPLDKLPTQWVQHS